MPDLTKEKILAELKYVKMKYPDPFEFKRKVEMICVACTRHPNYDLGFILNLINTIVEDNGDNGIFYMNDQELLKAIIDFNVKTTFTC